MNLDSKTHTVGNTKRWRVKYAKWLANGASLASATVTSSSSSCTISNSSVLGTDVYFYLNGGTLNEIVTVTLQVTDTLSPKAQVRYDTITFTVVAA